MSLVDRVAQIRAHRQPDMSLSTPVISKELLVKGLIDRSNVRARGQLPHNPETLTFTSLPLSTQISPEERHQVLDQDQVEALLKRIKDQYWECGQMVQLPHGYALELAYNTYGNQTRHQTREFVGYDTRLVEDNKTYGVGEHKRTLYHYKEVALYRTTGETYSPYAEREMRHTLLVGALAPDEIQGFQFWSPNSRADRQAVNHLPAGLHLAFYIDPLLSPNATDRLVHTLKINGYYPHGGGLFQGSSPLCLNRPARQILSPDQGAAQFIDALAQYVVENDLDRIPLRYQISKAARRSSMYLY